MKKKLVAAVAACAALALSAVMLAGCSGGSANTAANNAANASGSTDTAKTLIVGFDAEYPPYGYLADSGAAGYTADDGNTYTGFDLDLANEVCTRNGWTLQVKPIDWDSKDALLGSGDINCIWNGFTMEGREGQYEFTDPYMLNQQVIVVKAGSDIKSSADLAGKTVITQAGSGALEALESDDFKDLNASFKGGKVQTIADYNNAFMQLDSGQVDAIVCDLSMFMTHDNATPNTYTNIETLTEEHYVAAFAKGDTETAQAVTATLKEMVADGTVEKIAANYGDDIDYENLWCLK